MLRPGGILALAFLSSTLWAQVDRVRVWQDSITLPTYREHPPDAIPPFDQLALAGIGNYSVYPYTLRTNMTSEKYDARRIRPTRKSLTTSAWRGRNQVTIASPGCCGDPCRVIRDSVWRLNTNWSAPPRGRATGKMPWR